MVNAIPKNWIAKIKNPIQNVTYLTTVSTLTTSSIYSSLLIKNHISSSHSRD